MTVHYLKIWPEYFEKVDTGRKSVELRFNDRDYRMGDRLCLQEYDPDTRSYTGRECWVEVTDVLQGGPWLAEGFAALSIREIGRRWCGSSP